MADAIIVRAPKEIFNVKEFRDGLDAVFDATVDEAERLFQSSVQHFTTKPAVYKKTSKTAGGNKGVVGIRDEKYARLSNGTTKHLVGVGGKYMRFPGFRMPPNMTVKGGLGANKHLYKPKTSPDRIESTPGFPMVGTQMIVRRGPWMVSGIEPRKFDVQIANAIRPMFVDGSNAVIDKAMKGKK